MDLKHILLGGCLATLSTLAMAEPAAWLPAAGGQLPPGAQAQGREQLPGNEPLYACRALYAGPGKAAGLHPGKLRPEFGSCHIGYGGAEIGIPNYEVLTAPVRWVAASGGAIPPHAMVAGHEGEQDGGADLALCRAHYPPGSNGVHIGKIRPEFGACNIGWGGKEVQIQQYEVAVELHDWIPARDGNIPAGAEAQGREQPPGNEPLYACRARYADPGKRPGLHPGKIRPEFGSCHIGYGGQEIAVPQYEVLVVPVHWLHTEGGHIPPDAIVAGHEGPQDGGADLALCRAHYPAGTSGVHIGKTRPEFGACNIGWGGKEVQVQQYEVAVPGRDDEGYHEHDHDRRREHDHY